MISFCGLQLANTSDIEIGWWLAPSHWGRGLATEAGLAILHDGFERAGLTRIVAVAHPDRRASRRVMEKIPMRYERNAQHKGIDVVLYAIHASEILNSRAPL
jgi:ribosomal-protein-alanine N-acetyltransferase